MPRWAVWFCLVATLGGPAPAWPADGWLDDAALADTFAGRTVAGALRPGPMGDVWFAETLARDGSLDGRAGLGHGEPRWAWHGTWTVRDGMMCRDVPATNTTDCVRLRRAGSGLAAQRQTGKLGAPSRLTAIARLVDSGPSIEGWTTSAIVVFLAREGPALERASRPGRTPSPRSRVPRPSRRDRRGETRQTDNLAPSGRKRGFDTGLPRHAYLGEAPGKHRHELLQRDQPTFGPQSGSRARRPLDDRQSRQRRRLAHQVSPHGRIDFARGAASPQPLAIG